MHKRPLKIDTASTHPDSLDGDLDFSPCCEKVARIEDLEIGRIIGEGGWGSVRHAIHKETSQSYAVKTMSKLSLIQDKQ